MRHKRFVLDTNVWVSYFINNKAILLADYIAQNKITFFACDELIVEIKRVLAYPHLAGYKINITAAVKFIKNITVHCEIKYPIKKYIPDDKDDNYLIALALQTSSGYITSGDKHILSSKKALEIKFKKLQILTLSEFEKMMR